MHVNTVSTWSGCIFLIDIFIYMLIGDLRRSLIIWSLLHITWFWYLHAVVKISFLNQYNSILFYYIRAVYVAFSCVGTGNMSSSHQSNMKQLKKFLRKDMREKISQLDLNLKTIKSQEISEKVLYYCDN